jgi:hypothetical protein
MPTTGGDHRANSPDDIVANGFANPEADIVANDLAN